MYTYMYIYTYFHRHVWCVYVFTWVCPCELSACTSVYMNVGAKDEWINGWMMDGKVSERMDEWVGSRWMDIDGWLVR